MSCNKLETASKLDDIVACVVRVCVRGKKWSKKAQFSKNLITIDRFSLHSILCHRRTAPETTPKGRKKEEKKETKRTEKEATMEKGAGSNITTRAQAIARVLGMYDAFVEAHRAEYLEEVALGTAMSQQEDVQQEFLDQMYLLLILFVLVPYHSNI